MTPFPQDFPAPSTGAIPAWNPITALQNLNDRPKNQRPARPGKVRTSSFTVCLSRSGTGASLFFPLFKTGSPAGECSA